MFTLNIDSLPAASQANYIAEELADKEIARSNNLFLHAHAALLRKSELVGKPFRHIYRIKHPSLKYIRVPQEFLVENPDSNAPACEKYIVSDLFRRVSAADIPNICIYFGIFANIDQLGEKKCKNHAHCQDFQSYLATEGVDKFIRECNSLESHLTFDIIHSFFNSSGDARVHPNNKALSSKVKNCFWFDCTRGSVQVKVVGNVIVPKGESSFPLISTIVENNSYDIKMSTADLGNYPQITCARIFNSRVYISAMEGVNISSDIQLGSLNNINLDYKPMCDHKMIVFEIDQFKNSNWPMRALTDSLITFFARSHCIPATMHWSYSTPLIREKYLLFCSAYPELCIGVKDIFLAYITMPQHEHEECSLTSAQIESIKYSLTENRSFNFLAPLNFDLSEFDLKMSSLMTHLSSRRTLSFKSYEMKFEALEEVNNIISLDGFFPTVPIVKGELSLMLMKPNFTTLTNLELFDNILSSYGQIIKFDVIPKISNEQFNALYDSCLTRPYGAAWKDYMQSDPVIACVFASDNLLVTRAKIIKLRQESKVVWIKNIIHCSSSANESLRDLRIFFPSIDITQLNLELVQMYGALTSEMMIVENQVTKGNKKRSADDDCEELFDNTGLPMNFPLALRQNPEIVQFMKYIVEQTKKPSKRQRVV
jgi:hypothetical protein